MSGTKLSQLGNKGGGRPKGAKSKKLPPDMKLEVLQRGFTAYRDIMLQMATGKTMSQRKWFADQYRRLLPRDEAISVTGDKQLVIVVPAPPKDCPVPTVPPAADNG